MVAVIASAVDAHWIGDDLPARRRRQRVSVRASAWPADAVRAPTWRGPGANDDPRGEVLTWPTSRLRMLVFASAATSSPRSRRSEPEAPDIDAYLHVALGIDDSAGPTGGHRLRPIGR
jgi:hypothetical protein